MKMVKLIPGRRGSGKTKLLIEAIRNALNESKGNVVTIQIGNSLNTQISAREARLINVEDYGIAGCYSMYGFASGIMASDYDCTHIFVDGILRIIRDDRQDLDKIATMLDKLDKVSSDSTVVTFTYSADVSEIPEQIRKYL